MYFRLVAGPTVVFCGSTALLNRYRTRVTFGYPTAYNAEWLRAEFSVTFSAHAMVGFHLMAASRYLGEIVASASGTEFAPTTPPEP
jgi:hypothetical protein